MPDIVYLVTNPSMDGLVKIGRTTDLERRLRELYNTNVPVPFECIYACTVPDNMDVEKALHSSFSDYRVNPKREFFRINPEKVITMLKLIALEEIRIDEVRHLEDEADERAAAREIRRKSNINFRLIDVPVGSTLTFVKDETITATVINATQIEFEGQITSLSASVRTVWVRLGYADYEKQGPLYWCYEGETLQERRDRLEASPD